jgi:chemotaxis signal transduction protein
VSRNPVLMSADALRHTFDRTFADARGEKAEGTEDFLAIRVGVDPYAVRLAEIASVHADRRVVPVPSRARSLLGLVALRGLLAPVYDLRVLLGYAGGGPPRWLLLLRTEDPVVFAADVFERHVRARSDEISPEDRGPESPNICGVLRTADAVRPLIHIASLLEAITRQADVERPPEER